MDDRREFPLICLVRTQLLVYSWLGPGHKVRNIRNWLQYKRIVLAWQRGPTDRNARPFTASVLLRFHSSFSDVYSPRSTLGVTNTCAECYKTIMTDARKGYKNMLKENTM